MNKLDSEQNANKLIVLISQQLLETKKMLEILLREEQALQENNLSDFETTLQQKQLQSNKLKELESKLLTLDVFSNGELLTKSTIDSIIAQTPKKNIQNQLSSLWIEFQHVLSDCSRQNQINNRIIEASRISLQQAIDILHGGNSSHNIYRASGEKDGTGENQTLAVV